MDNQHPPYPPPPPTPGGRERYGDQAPLGFDPQAQAPPRSGVRPGSGPVDLSCHQAGPGYAQVALGYSPGYQQQPGYASYPPYGGAPYPPPYPPPPGYGPPPPYAGPGGYPPPAYPGQYPPVYPPAYPPAAGAPYAGPQNPNPYARAPYPQRAPQAPPAAPAPSGGEAPQLGASTQVMPTSQPALAPELEKTLPPLSEESAQQLLELRQKSSAPPPAPNPMEPAEPQVEAKPKEEAPANSVLEGEGWKPSQAVSSAKSSASAQWASMASAKYARQAPILESSSSESSTGSKAESDSSTRSGSGRSSSGRSKLSSIGPLGIPPVGWLLVAGVAFLAITIFLVWYNASMAPPPEKLPVPKEPIPTLPANILEEYSSTDPVSKKPVSSTSPYRLEVYGTTFIFENEANMRAFSEDPTRYVKPRIKVRVQDVESGSGSTQIRIVGPDGRPLLEGQAEPLRQQVESVLPQPSAPPERVEDQDFSPDQRIEASEDKSVIAPSGETAEPSARDFEPPLSPSSAVPPAAESGSASGGESLPPPSYSDVPPPEAAAPEASSSASAPQPPPPNLEGPISDEEVLPPQ